MRQLVLRTLVLVFFIAWPGVGLAQKAVLKSSTSHGLEIDFMISREDVFPHYEGAGSIALNQESRFRELKLVFEFTVAVPPSGELSVEKVERTAPVSIPSSINPFDMAKGLGGHKAVVITGYAWVRYQRFARIEVRPLALDEKSQWVLFSTIRARFRIRENTSISASSVPEDTHFEPVYRKLFPNYEQAKEWRSMPPASSFTPWFHSADTYLKMPVGADGLYKVTSASLSAAGISPSAIDVNTIKLLVNGGQVPFEPVGLGDGTFNDGDAIVFFGKKNRGDYTDTLMYWLTWGSGSGTRIESALPADTTRLIPVIQRRLHLEENGTIEYYQGGGGPDQQNETGYNPGEGWYWAMIWVNTTFRTSFDLPNYSSNGPGLDTLRVRIQGSSGYPSENNKEVKVPHRVVVTLNGFVFDTVKVDAYNSLTAVLPVPKGTLKQAGNEISVFNAGNFFNARYDQVQLDWIDIDYFASRVLNSGTDFFSTTTEMGVGRIELSGTVGTRMLAYAVSGDVRKLPLQLRGGKVIIDVPSSGPTTIVVGDLDDLPTPPLSRVAFKNLSSQSTQVDYLVITHHAFKSYAQRLVQYHAQADGFSGLIVDVEDVYNEFDYGNKTPDAIKNFLRAVQVSWPAPAPAYVCLFGDANKDSKYYKGRERFNYVPSYGIPVGDWWFAVVNDTTTSVPSYYLGRIPAQTASEAEIYVNRVETYHAYPVDDFNKRLMLMLHALRKERDKGLRWKPSSDEIINSFIEAPPLGGVGVRYYTLLYDPLPPEMQDSLEIKLQQGAVWISYYGHGGTEQWNNGITKPGDLHSNVPRPILVTDFSCSTGKFAEPDIESFSENMIFDPSDYGAIAFLGSSGLGYETSLNTVRTEMYRVIGKESERNLGRAIFMSKLVLGLTAPTKQLPHSTRQLLEQYELIGDPGVFVAIPTDYNLRVEPQDITTDPEIVFEDRDSVTINVRLRSLGLVIPDSFRVTINIDYGGQRTYQNQFVLRSVLYDHTISFQYPVYNASGVHTIQVTVDPDNWITESDETDNSALLKFNVGFSRLRFIRPQPNLDVENDTLWVVLANPSIVAGDMEAQIELSDDSSFSRVLKNTTIPLGSITTKYAFTQLPPGKRIYLKARLLGDGKYLGSAIMTECLYKAGEKENSWVARFTVDPEINQLFSKKFIHWTGNSWKFEPDSVEVVVISQGGDACKGELKGGMASISIGRRLALPPGAAGRGLNVVSVSRKTGEVSGVRTFDFVFRGGGTELPNPDVRYFSDFIEALPDGDYVMAGVMDDITWRVTGKSIPVAQEAFRKIGAGMVYNGQNTYKGPARPDTIQFRSSYAIIGQKGGAVGSATEGMIKNWCTHNLPEMDNKLEIRDTILIGEGYGVLTSRWIGPAYAYASVAVSAETSNGRRLTYLVLGRKTDGTVDTLYEKVQPGTQRDLSGVDANVYPYIRFVIEFESDQGEEPAKLTDLRFVYTPSFDLAMNSQSFNVTKITTDPKVPVKIPVKLKNSGYVRSAPATLRGAFKDDPSNSVQASIPPIEKDSILSVSFTIPASSVPANRVFVFNVNPTDKDKELVGSNNYFELPVTIVPDTIPPDVELLVNGVRVYDGDYVAPTAQMEILMKEQIPQQATIDNFTLYVDDTLVTEQYPERVRFEAPYKEYAGRLVYETVLSEGMHFVRYNVRDDFGNAHFNEDMEILLEVSAEKSVQNVYNYPNPMQNETWFTFEVVGTSPPDQVRILIYTVAGRKIREIDVDPSVLHVGFCSVKWDGRDEDGDEVGSGVYFFKVIVSYGTETTTSIYKLSVLR